MLSLAISDSLHYTTDIFPISSDSFRFLPILSDSFRTFWRMITIHHHAFFSNAFPILKLPNHDGYIPENAQDEVLCLLP